MEELFTYFRQWDVEIMAQFDDGLFDYNPESVLKEKAEYRKKHKLSDDYPWTGGALHFWRITERATRRFLISIRGKELTAVSNR